MNSIRFGTLMLALGLVVGGGLGALVRPPVPANAQAMGGMHMDARAKSAGDAQMNAAMDAMSHAMATAKLTGDQDRDFMVMMIPHHAAAVDMAKTELHFGKHPELKALARDIIASQSEEIGRMHRWLGAWYGAK